MALSLLNQGAICQNCCRESCNPANYNPLGFPLRSHLLISNNHKKSGKDHRLHCSSSSTKAPILEDGFKNGCDPVPVVILDQDTDPCATVVEIYFGDRLGSLLDTVTLHMESLRELGLNVTEGRASSDSVGTHKIFSITLGATGRKVDDPELLEAIRLTVISNLLKYHPETSIQLAMGEFFGTMPPKHKLDVDMTTRITIFDEGPTKSLLSIETADRPGLLLDIMKVIDDISLSVVSMEFDTEGLVARSKFHVSYKGFPLAKPRKEVLKNSLRYFLRRPSTEDASF
ncbi:ACT domain-containing protein ACR11 [Amborella trichopoda]|uniref:ACT domain-containing protein ACR11 n=1 Tax=Amborella trichopoda TaxID=13333 RepID=UPI0009C0F73E|nr:ACT domain-containing protein ACR11 [Amborella trichopoda]|eukprot:XP_020529118.1 ACT domain-containing protein ACR11 [Amborella trichopoda]